LYNPTQLDEGELAKFGLTVDDFANDIVEIWPENLESFDAFTCMSTQWRAVSRGMEGQMHYIGLDYSALREIWQRLKIPLSRRDDVFQDIRVMENQALKTMRQNKG
jgi:hypothetical protein